MVVAGGRQQDQNSIGNGTWHGVYRPERYDYREFLPIEDVYELDANWGLTGILFWKKYKVYYTLTAIFRCYFK